MAVPAAGWGAAEIRVFSISVAIVGTINTIRKYWAGFGLITQVTAVRLLDGGNNDIRCASRRDVAPITGRFPDRLVYGRPIVGKVARSLVISFTSYAADKWCVTIGIYTDANG